MSDILNTQPFPFVQPVLPDVNLTYNSNSNEGLILAGGTAGSQQQINNTLNNISSGKLASFSNRTSFIGNKVLFSITLQDASKTTWTFGINPNFITKSRKKRLAKLAVFAGTVIQDFGYEPFIIHIRGTTGYQGRLAILGLEQLFKNEYTRNGIILTLDDVKNQLTAWSSFSHQIESKNPFLYNFEMEFILLGNNTEVENPTSFVSSIQSSPNQVSTNTNTINNILSSLSPSITPSITSPNSILILTPQQNYEYDKISVLNPNININPTIFKKYSPETIKQIINLIK